jgi:glutamyl/glutaminyl-tRNA synthetase
MISLQGRRFVRTRIAPTPSGYLHLGNLASFILTAGLARRHGASILLRIDDIDRARARPAYIDDIFETLHYLGIPWDEGPMDPTDFVRNHAQLQRMDLYRAALAGLAASGQIFACDCSRKTLAAHAGEGGYPGTCLAKQIPLDTPGVCWRLKTAEDATVMIHDLVQGPASKPLPVSMRHFIVRKKDHLPAYQLASVIDDIHFGVDLIVRGEDLFESTLAQLYLSACLGNVTFAQVRFVHHVLLQNAAGEKMSKSAGDISIQLLRKQGKDRGSICRQVALLLGLDMDPSDWDDLFTAIEPHLLRTIR